jgi:hypothetical protein
MKEDRLKEFIDQNLSSFEEESPRADLWSDIENDLDGKDESVSERFNWRMVAAIAAMFILGIMVTRLIEPSAPDLADEPQKSELLLASISTEMAEVEMYYTAELETHQERLGQYEVDEEFLDEITILKLEFEELKKEIGTGANNAQIVEAMIENYRLRLSLLEDLLEAFEGSENETERHEISL